jgi:hypothetical protein
MSGAADACGQVFLRDYAIGFLKENNDELAQNLLSAGASDRHQKLSLLDRIELLLSELERDVANFARRGQALQNIRALATQDHRRQPNRIASRLFQRRLH